MTPLDLINTLLLTGFHLHSHESEGFEESININNTTIEFSRHPVFQKSIWRYANVHVFDIGAIILEDERVLVLYEGEEPNYGCWEHYRIFNNPEETWKFIRSFMQKHPNK